MAACSHRFLLRAWWNWPRPGKLVRALPVLFVVLQVAPPVEIRGQSPSTPGSSNMEQAVALLGEARLHFRQIRDYECLLISRERVHGEVLAENRMIMRVRNQPFSVYLAFQAPAAKQGQEVCYVAGRNLGMMRVHSAGFLGILGFVSIDPHDARVFKEARHPITQAGMGVLLESTARYWDMELRLNQTEVHISDCRINGRPCTWIETIHSNRSAGSFYAYRCVLCLDKETSLPVHSEAYDWPHPGGPPEGDLLEWYSYLNVRCNVGLGDRDFDR